MSRKCVGTIDDHVAKRSLGVFVSPEEIVILISHLPSERAEGSFTLTVELAGRLIELLSTAQKSARLLTEGKEDLWKEKLKP